MPDYYRLFPDSHGSSTVMDVCEALGFNFNVGCMLKYLIRHGRKPGASALEDIDKLIDCALRERARLESAAPELEARRPATASDVRAALEAMRERPSL